MSLLHLLSYVGILAAACFLVLSLASGLLWISELIEEHSHISKVVGIRAIYSIIALQVLLYLFDSLPLLHTLFSIICHIVYLQNFSTTWPFISLTSVSFITSCLLSVLNHFVWFFYFSRVSREARYRSQRTFRGSPVPGKEAPGFADVSTFFAICVWLIPLFLFLSLSANDNALPTSENGHPQINVPFSPTHPISTSRSSLFKTIIDFFPRIRSRRDRAEGIIVTHTPSPSAPSTPYQTNFAFPTSPNPGLALSTHSLSSDSVYPRTSEELMSRNRISLRAPPKRSATNPNFGFNEGMVSSSARRSSDDVSVGLSQSSLHVSKAFDESPFRRRTSGD